MNIYCVVFEQFETLDLMGPVEFLAAVPQAKMHYISQQGGLVESRQGFKMETEACEQLLPESCLLIVGGQGTRSLIENQSFISWLTPLVAQSKYCLSVCTGSSLLAQTGYLDGKKATSNKRAFDWVVRTRPAVHWLRDVRWVTTGKFYTSSGISAGIDMSLSFIADRYGRKLARELAHRAEYHWKEQAEEDEFSH